MRGEELDGGVAHHLVLPAGGHVDVLGAVNGTHSHHIPPTVDIQGQLFEGGGEVDTVTAPGAVEFHQPGRGAATDCGLEVCSI